ncbi:MAG: dipeptidase [Polyangiaceae bacterium]
MIGTLWLSIALADPAHADPDAEARIDAKARSIHAKVLVLDSHVDLLLPSNAARYAGPDGKSAADFDKLTRGGIGAIAFAIAVGPGPRTEAGVSEAHAEAAAKLSAIQSFLKEHPEKLALAKTADDVSRLHQQGKIAVIESFLNARSIGKDLTQIDQYYRDGVRLFGFTHAGNNAFADSSRPDSEPSVEHHGLSALGKQGVAKLNRLGVIIDVSQLTPEGLQQVLQLSKAPVIASHSAARALVDTPRNLSDAELDAIKRNGGVVQVTAFSAYLAQPPKDFRAKVAALRQRFSLAPSNAPDEGVETLPEAQRGQFIQGLQRLAPRATLKQYVDHIDYIAKRIGVDHVGIGSDFNHGAGVIGFQDESEALNVTRELVRRGYDEQQIGQVWSGNFLRVFRAVEAQSKKLNQR